MALLVFRRLRILAGGYRHFRILGIGALALGCGDVHDFACHHISLCDCVAGFVVLGLAGLQGFKLPLITGQVVCHGDICDRQVSVILDRDLVLDRCAQRIALLRCLARCDLLYGQMALLRFSLCGRAGLLREIADLCCHRILKASLEYILFLDHIGCRRLYGRTRLHTLEFRFRKCDSIDLGKCDISCFSINIGCGYCECDCLSKFVLLVVNTLCNNKFVINGFVATSVSNFQGSVSCFDLVVLGYISVALLDDDIDNCCRAGSHQRLFTGKGDFLSISVHKRSAGNLIAGFFCFQRLAVIYLGPVFCFDCEFYLCDRQFTILSAYSELLCHIVAVRVLDNGCTGDFARVATRVCSGCRCLQSADSVGVAFDFKLQSLETAYGFLGSVVLVLVTLGFYGDLVLSLAVCDLQCAVLSADLVVFSLGARVQCVGECVLTLADYGPGARDVVDCALAIREAVAAHGNIFLGILCQRFAVIFLLPVRGGQGDGALGDLQLSGLVRDRELRCHVIAVFVLHDRGPRHVHRIVSRVCFGCRCGQAAHSILAAFDLELQRLEAAHGLLFAIVLELAAVGLDLDLVLGVAGLDRQGSVACRDGVVVRLRSVVQCVGECVLAGPDQGLAARDAVGCALALRESVAAHGDIRLLVLCQRLSVVFLLGCR